MVTKKVLSMSTGFIPDIIFVSCSYGIGFIHFLTHFYILKASHLKYTCTFAAKPRAQGHCCEEDSEKCAMGENRPRGEDEEESFPRALTENKPNSGN